MQCCSGFPNISLVKLPLECGNDMPTTNCLHLVHGHRFFSFSNSIPNVESLWLLLRFVIEAEFSGAQWDNNVIFVPIRSLWRLARDVKLCYCKIFFCTNIAAGNTFASVENCEENQNKGKNVISYHKLCKVKFGWVTKEWSC